MVAYGFPKVELGDDLKLASRLGAQILEILPDWRTLPDPLLLRKQVEDAGFAIHSAHGCWGSQAIQANRVDLGSLEPEAQRQSIDDLRRCIDWLSAAAGRCLVVHPGGLSSPSDAERRQEALASGLVALARHAEGTEVIVCVENMPPGVHPGSRMNDLFHLVNRLGHAGIALALDTGHAHIAAQVETETLAAGSLLRTTHVHDNDGRQDSHLAPRSGTIDWEAWARSLDRIDYDGPIMLECVRYLRQFPETLNEEFLASLKRLCVRSRMATE